jgi:uncharacterized protein YbaP (TraB family)
LKRSLLFGCAISLVCSTALAQSTAPPVQDWSDVETVTVIAPKLGPALWHIARNGSDIWILGIVSPVPDKLDWNADEVTDIIKGANIVYLQPELKAGLFEASWFLLTGMHKLKQPDGQTLLGSLPPDLRARYSAWLTKLSEDADTDEDYLPAIAALDLENTFHSKTGLDGRAINSQIDGIADHNDTDAKPIASFAAMPIVDEVQNMTADSQARCMRDALDDIDAESIHATAAAQAWTTGDLAGLKAHYSDAKLYGCFDQTKSFASYRDQVVGETMSALHESLTKPGKSLIVVSLGYLLRKDGLLDRLKTEGITVEGPPH